MRQQVVNSPVSDPMRAPTDEQQVDPADGPAYAVKCRRTVWIIHDFEFIVKGKKGHLSGPQTRWPVAPKWKTWRLNPLLSSGKATHQINQLVEGWMYILWQTAIVIRYYGHFLVGDRTASSHKVPGTQDRAVHQNRTHPESSSSPTVRRHDLGITVWPTDDSPVPSQTCGSLRDTMSILRDRKVWLSYHLATKLRLTLRWRNLGLRSMISSLKQCQFLTESVSLTRISALACGHRREVYSTSL